MPIEGLHRCPKLYGELALGLHRGSWLAGILRAGGFTAVYVRTYSVDIRDLRPSTDR